MTATCKIQNINSRPIFRRDQTFTTWSKHTVTRYSSFRLSRNIFTIIITPGPFVCCTFYAVVTTTIRLRFDSHSSGVRLLTKRSLRSQWRNRLGAGSHADLFVCLFRPRCSSPVVWRRSWNCRSAVELQSNGCRIAVKS